MQELAKFKTIEGNFVEIFVYETVVQFSFMLLSHLLLHNLDLCPVKMKENSTVLLDGLPEHCVYK